MSKIIGIDLGTGNSCVSIIEHGNAIVIPNSEGKRTTPSIVAFLKNNERKIGDPAKRQAVTNATKTISSIKRFMGSKFKDIESIIDSQSYEIININNLPMVKIDNKTYTPQEISAIILQKMKLTAEDYLGQKVTEAVITVPAYFNDSQRQATKEAGEIAGLIVKRIINEPTAASLAYGLDKAEEDKTIAVFDIGAGTFDISILELGGGVFEVRSTNGDTFLGGDDFDDVIVDWIAEDFKYNNNIDLRKDPMAHQRLKEAAEKAKCELSNSTQTEINLPYIIPIDNIPQHIVKTITKSEFEKLSNSLLQKLRKPCEIALKDAKITSKDINEVILVGGSSRIPAIQKIVREIFGREPSKNINPDEAISLGAAIQGGVLSGEVKDILLLDVTPLSLGIETMGGVCTRLIESNTTIPTSKEETFSTASDNQPEVDIHILQGERPMAQNNKSLGRFKLDGIPPAMRGIPQILVKFDIDSNGILNVSATNKATGKIQSIRIESSSNLSDIDIERMRKEAEKYASEDKIEKNKIEKINEADSTIFNTEKQMKEFDEKLDENDKTKLNESLEKLKTSHKNKDVNQITEDIKSLNETWNVVSSKMYSQPNNQSTNEQKTQDSNLAPDLDDVEDVDFDEIKDEDDKKKEDKKDENKKRR